MDRCAPVVNQCVSLQFVSEPNENKEPEDEQCRDSSSETNMEPGILKIEVI